VSPPPLVLDRLIMVATSAWEPPQVTSAPEVACWEHGQPRAGHGALLGHLLNTRAAGDAWIGRDVSRDVTSPVDYHRCDTDDARDLVEKLPVEVTDACTRARTRVDWPITERRKELIARRHRIVLTPERLDAVTRRVEPHERNKPLRQPQAGPPEWPKPEQLVAEGRPVEYLVALDLRFDFYLNRPLCHLSMSVWSDRPLNARYLPHDSLLFARKQIRIDELESYAYRFRMIMRETVKMLDCFLREPELWVYQRKHVLPIFWVPIPEQREIDAADYQRRQPELRRSLTRILLGLGDPEDCISAGSVINGEFDVLRRFKRGRALAKQPDDPRHSRISRARYLIIPSAPSGAASAEGDDKDREHQDQEDRTADVVSSLTDLEAHGASSLHEVHRDLQIWHAHLSVYDTVVERGAFLWDGLSAHLVGRRRTVRQVHQAVELLHQLLLQGIGDLAYLANRTDDCVARIEEAADQLRADYDDQLTEHHRDRESGLRGTLAHVGLFERVTQHGHQTQQEAGRVKGIYDDLLRAVSYAFDEWRVRESDVLQRLSSALGLFLALIGIVTVLDATIELKDRGQATGDTQGLVPPDIATIFGGGETIQQASVIVSWFIGLLVTVIVARFLAVWYLSGRLGSTRFRRTYTDRRRFHGPRGMWRLLRDISTDRLDDKARRLGDDPHGWADLDDKLARRFAGIWDRVSAMEGTDRHDNLGKDIAAQTRRIEKWGLHSLLLTERARQMHRYRLPKLTCLYRGCTRLPGSFLTGAADADDPQGRPDTFAAARQSNQPTMVHFTELALSLNQAGLTWEQADELDRWLRNRRPQSARHLLDLITSVKIVPRMAPRTTERTLKKVIRPDLAKPEMADYPGDFLDQMKPLLATEDLAVNLPAGSRVGRNWNDALTVTADTHGTPVLAKVWLNRTPALRDLGPLLRHRLGHPREKVLLATTGTAPRRVVTLARLCRIKVLDTGWLALPARRD
jgi:hypothetical protein